MLIEEAQWLNRHLSQMSPNDLYPMCNIGSSTEHYRRIEQPYVDKYLFEPARMKDLQIIHVDAKPAAGVDLVGDLTDPSFIAQLMRLNVRSVMCCNLLEHVTDRSLIRDAVLSIIKGGGYIIATVPYRFPYHEDPIDTMYRPTIGELVSLFVGTTVHKAAIVRASRFAHDMHGNYWSLFRMTARAAMPLYRSQGWWASVQRLGQIAAGYKVTCAVLRKIDGPLGI